MEIRKIKLFLVMLCSGFSMLGLASDDMEIEEGVGMPKIRLLFGSNKVGERKYGEFYLGMSFAELDGYLKGLFGLPVSDDLLVFTSDDQRTYIEPTKYPYKFLEIEDVGVATKATVINVVSRRPR